jgi:hypothetical protein
VAFNQWMRVFDTLNNLAQLSGRFRRGGPPADPEQPPAQPWGALGQLETRLAGVVVAALKRHAAERALGQVRIIAAMAIGVWMISAALGVWMPGMRGGVARGLLAAGWAFVLCALAAAFAAWQRISAWSASSAGNTTIAGGPALAERLAPWLLLGAIALSGTALLVAL